MKVADKPQKISVSVPTSLLEYAEQYQQTHGLQSRSDVIAAALKALRERELAEAYQALSLEYQKNPNLMIGEDLGDGLEPSEGKEWL